MTKYNYIMKKIIFLKFCFFFFSLTAQEFITIQSTTSIRDSGFYNYIQDKYQEESSTKLKLVAVGTGQAIENAKKCDADLLFVHHEPSEIKFVKNGYGLYRKVIMHNDFILVGPKNDPAGIKIKKNIKEALKIIYNSKHPFVSRGDKSGTHLKEQELWALVGIKIEKKKSDWYFESGSGMGSSLNFAVNIGAYILSDRSTWISFGNKKNHTIIVENEPLLVNNYGIIPINPKNCPTTKSSEAEKFIYWLKSKEGRSLINNFRVNGQQVFFSSQGVN